MIQPHSILAIIIDYISISGVLGSSDKSTVGALDLGGGSTQITFVPNSPDTLREGEKLNYIDTFRFLHKTFKVYTHR